MPRRNILTERQRSALLDLPTDESSLLKHYTLADDDRDVVDGHRTRFVWLRQFETDLTFCR